MALAIRQTSTKSTGTFPGTESVSPFGTGDTPGTSSHNDVGPQSTIYRARECYRDCPRYDPPSNPTHPSLLRSQKKMSRACPTLHDIPSFFITPIPFHASSDPHICIHPNATGTIPGTATCRPHEMPCLPCYPKYRGCSRYTPPSAPCQP